MPKPLGIYSLRPVSLPNPPLPKGTIAIVEQAITEAWRVIKEHPEDGFQLDQADEERITVELRHCLTDRVLDGRVVPGFDPEHFWVSREGKFVSYNGKHLKKMPDLHIGVVRDISPGLRSADGVFVECKPVDDAHNLVSHYCKKGILRFVKGEYAWAMTEGLMIGYVSGGYAITLHLNRALASQKAALKTRGGLAACAPSAATKHGQHPHTTIHHRGFKYPKVGGKAPDITLRHLWFTCN